MDGVFFIVAIGLLVLLGPWLPVWRISSRRKHEREEEQARQRELTSRVYALEQTMRALQARPSTPVAQESTPKSTGSPVAASFPLPFSAPLPAPPPSSQPSVTPEDELSPSVRVAENWVTRGRIEPAIASSSMVDRAIPPAPPTPVAPRR
jgi:hypothetical protein